MCVCVCVCVCVLFHAHYNYLWVWVCHLLPAHVPISLRVVRELHPDAFGVYTTMWPANRKSQFEWIQSCGLPKVHRLATPSQLQLTCLLCGKKQGRFVLKQHVDVAPVVFIQRYQKIDLVFTKQELVTVGRHYKSAGWWEFPVAFIWLRVARCNLIYEISKRYICLISCERPAKETPQEPGINK